MKNPSPKGRTPSLIGSANGRPKKVVVEKKSTCNRCEDDILVGQDCFGIPKLGGAFSSVRRYCKECFDKIVSQTYIDLEEVKKL
jgi:hypothetical protein